MMARPSVRFDPAVEEGASHARVPGMPSYEARSKRERSAKRLRMIAYRNELVSELKLLRRDPEQRARVETLERDLDTVDEILDKFPDRTWYEPDNDSDLDDDERVTRDVALKNAVQNAKHIFD